MLAPFVEVIWYWETNATDSQPDRVLPHGAFELVISLSNPEHESLISGPQTRPMIVDPGSVSPIIGAHFRPGGVSALFRQDASAFRNIDVPLADVCRRRTQAIISGLSGRSGPQAYLTALEKSLTRFALDAPAPHPAVSLAIQDFHREQPANRIQDLVLESGVSQRRFIELFTDRIGLTPKLYARIQRFQRTVHKAAGHGPVDWSALAFELGYSDQAHLIRDFREFSNLRPSEYTPRSSDQANHVPVS